MGMGYGANYADVIEIQSIKKICPKEFQAFFNIIDEAKVSLDSVAEFLDKDSELDLSHIKEDDEAVRLQDVIISTWKKLTRAFHKKTDLILYIGFHNSGEEGDRYDEVSGPYFSVGGLYQLSPAGKKLLKTVGKRNISRKFFVTFG